MLLSPVWKSALIAVGVFTSMCSAVTESGAGLKTGSLRCEYLVNPIGVDDVRPRLSWRLSSTERGARQTAYEVQVATSADTLRAGTADLWSSGKVASDQQNGVEYAGTPMRSRQTAFWRVRTWNASDQAGPWSDIATWEAGLREPGDWQAKWITEGDVTPTARLKLLAASYETTNRKTTKDLLAILRPKVHDGRLDFIVESDYLGGDPAKDARKQLTVRYTLNDGPEITEILREGAHASLPPLPPQELRRAFGVAKPVARARLYATAMGLYDLRINGRAVTDSVFNPVWTDFRERVRYQAYDVTPLVKEGANAIAGSIGNGYYSGHIANSNYQFYGTRPALLAQLEITYTDGSTERVVTDDQWQKHAGPLVMSDVMLGEQYDARLAIPSSDPALPNDGQWSAVTVRDSNLPKSIDAQVAEPIRELEVLKAKHVTQPAPGKWLFDLGQNMVGVPRLRLNAPAGTRITVRYAEMLNPDGTIYTENYRAATSIDSYVCRGGGTETWQPQFTYHGFRYVELEGLTEKPDADTVLGIVQGSDTPAVGSFTCSDERINRLWNNIRWGQRGNFFGVPTDCPQRDERLGWMGDAQVFISTAVYNADVAAFFTKWLIDVDDAQMPDGAYQSTAPDTKLVRPGVPGWADAGVICPWQIYETYGDTRQLARHLPAMKRYVDWSLENSTNFIRDKNRGNDFGDWLAINAKTDKELLGTAYFAHSANLLAKSCRVLGDTAGQAKYAKLFGQIKAAFHDRYVKPDGTIGNGTQTCYALALAFDLLPNDERPTAAKMLADDVKAKGNHLSTGFLGVSYLLPTLSENGHADLAYTLLMQDTFPSWLFSIKHGATTIWERWDGYTPEKGFNSPGMNSFNHYSLGSCGKWLYERVAGIAQVPGSTGFEKLDIRPLTGGPLTHASAEYVSPRGPVKVSWKREGTKLTLDITVPPNASATVHVPTNNPNSVTESGKPAAKALGVKAAGNAADAAIFEIGSGTYRFEAETGRP
jgi:alpha-L-rhamnosidase